METTPAASLNAGEEVALAWANGMSREIDCEAIGGQAGEKYLLVGGRVRKLPPQSTCFRVDSLLA
jgi:hypothetical protein